MAVEYENALDVMRKFVVEDIPHKVEATAREIAFYALEKAVEFSPYVTGRFIAGWTITLDPGRYRSPESGQRTLDGAAAEALAASAGAIASIKFGKDFYLTNGVPYAPFVEYGSPTTQPYYITTRVAQSIGGTFGRIA